MAVKKASSKSSESKGQATPRNLAPKNGTKVKGGIKLENVKITSYQLGVLDNNG